MGWSGCVSVWTFRPSEQGGFGREQILGKSLGLGLNLNLIEYFYALRWFSYSSGTWLLFTLIHFHLHLQVEGLWLQIAIAVGGRVVARLRVGAMEVEWRCCWHSTCWMHGACPSSSLWTCNCLEWIHMKYLISDLFPLGFSGGWEAPAYSPEQAWCVSNCDGKQIRLGEVSKPCLSRLLASQTADSAGEDAETLLV